MQMCCLTAQFKSAELQFTVYFAKFGPGDSVFILNPEILDFAHTSKCIASVHISNPLLLYINHDWHKSKMWMYVKYDTYASRRVTRNNTLPGLLREQSSCILLVRLQSVQTISTWSAHPGLFSCYAVSVPGHKMSQGIECPRA